MLGGGRCVSIGDGDGEATGSDGTALGGGETTGDATPLVGGGGEGEGGDTVQPG